MTLTPKSLSSDASQNHDSCLNCAELVEAYKENLMGAKEWHRHLKRRGCHQPVRGVLGNHHSHAIHGNVIQSESASEPDAKKLTLLDIR